MECYFCGRFANDEDYFLWSGVTFDDFRYDACPNHHSEVFKMVVEESSAPISCNLTEIVGEPFLVRCAICANSQWVESDRDVEDWLLMESLENKEWYCPECDKVEK